jgi:translation elongation factor EF-G
MSAVEITIQSDDIGKLIKDVDRLHGAVESDKIKEEMGFAIMQTIRDHFSEIAQDSAHHESASSLGASQTGYYERARDSTQEPQVTAEALYHFRPNRARSTDRQRLAAT